MNSDADQTSQNNSRSDSKGVPLISKDSGKYCWVCFASEDEDFDAAWVQPCNCRGTTKWVRFPVLCLQQPINPYCPILGSSNLPAEMGG